MSNLTKREIVLEIYRKRAFRKQIVDTVQQTRYRAKLANGRNVELRNWSSGSAGAQTTDYRNPNKPEAEVIIRSGRW